MCLCVCVQVRVQVSVWLCCCVCVAGVTSAWAPAPEWVGVQVGAAPGLEGGGVAGVGPTGSLQLWHNPGDPPHLMCCSSRLQHIQCVVTSACGGAAPLVVSGASDHRCLFVG